MNAPSPAMQDALMHLEIAELRAEADRLWKAENDAIEAGDDVLAIDLQNQAWALLTKARDLEFEANLRPEALDRAAAFGARGIDWFELAVAICVKPIAPSQTLMAAE